MYKVLYFLFSLIGLIVIQVFIHHVYKDLNKATTEFIEVELNNCEIDKTTYKEFKPLRGEYIELQTICGNYPIIVEDYSNIQVIEVGNFITKLPNDKEFKISDKKIEQKFEIKSMQNQESTIHIISILFLSLILFITYKFWFKKLNFFKVNA